MSILKAGVATLAGTSLAGAFYLQVVQPHLARLAAESPEDEFEWTMYPASLPEGRSILKVTGIGLIGEASAQTAELNPFDVTEEAADPVEPRGVGYAGVGFGLAPERAERPRKREASALVAGVLKTLRPGSMDALLGGERGADAVFESAMSDAPAEVPAAVGAGTPDTPTGGDAEAETPTGDGDTPNELPDASATVTPEPATLALLASGLFALSIAGLRRRRH